LPYEQIGGYYFSKSINDFVLFGKYVITASNDSMIYVLNFSNLGNIYIADSLKLESQCQSLIINGSYVYALGTNELFVIDGSDINNLNLIKTLSFSNELTYFADYSEKLYVDAGEKCLIFDIKNPSYPHQIDSFLYDSYSYKLNVNKNYLYSILSRRIDVYNLNNKKCEWSLYFPDATFNISVFGKFGLALTRNGDAYLINLEYPSKPAVLEMVESDCNYGIIRDDKIYLLSDGLKVYLIKKSTK
jgi:hypothetical protein